MNEAGFFNEYGGPDIGYQTISLSILGQLKYFLNALLHLKEDIKCLDIKSRIKDFSDYQGFF